MVISASVEAEGESSGGWERRIIPYSNQVRTHIHIMTYQQVFTIYEKQVGECMSVIQLAGAVDFNE